MAWGAAHPDGGEQEAAGDARLSAHVPAARGGGACTGKEKQAVGEGCERALVSELCSLVLSVWVHIRAM
eukprot:361513-Chlamydomonas_euryale.AAC.4